MLNLFNWNNFIKKNPIVVRWGFFVVLLFWAISVSAQKKLQKSWDAQTLETVEIISEEVFRISLVSSESDTVRLEVLIEGEYAESVMIPVFQKNNTLRLQTGFHPFFSEDNDKLAAHKVIFIEMRLEIPSHLKVYVEAPIANLKTHGPFKKLTAQLRDGPIQVAAFSGEATLYTREGNINLEAIGGVSGAAISKNGIVDNQLPSASSPLIMAQSVNGDITLRKTPE